MNAVAYVDHLLRNREQVVSEIQDNKLARPNTRVSFVVFVGLSAFYGLIMGSRNLIHGGPDPWKYAFAAAIKLPVLFLLTLAICLPLLYVLNVLIGQRARFTAIVGLLMASVAVTAVVLASCAPIVLFFMLSTKSYAFIKLLNVIVFTIAGGYGVWFLRRGMLALRPEVPEGTAVSPGGVQTIMNWWLITYAVVGTQMAWLMRPFIGSQEFSFFRMQESNFYVHLVQMIQALGK